MSSPEDKTEIGDVKAILEELEAELATEEKAVAKPRRFKSWSPELPTPDPKPAGPVERAIIQAPLIQTVTSVEDDGGIRIKAQVSRDGMECTLMVNRTILGDAAWWFPTPDLGEGSPLPEAIFAVEGVLSLLVDDSTLVLSRSRGALSSWEEIATEVGARVREMLGAGDSLFSEAIQEGIPTAEEVSAGIQHVLDTEVNPGVAAHEGLITLERVRNNSVYIQMGGGCQGCSAADLTLKQGIHGAFRSAIPGLGGIYDETDHAAGVNPYYS
jgi:Fe-S cluster biogenesis protein NfuA